jgi:hypothetical protein
MSRTYKDRPSKFRFPEEHWDFGREKIPYTRISIYTGEEYECHYALQIKGAKTKKKKAINTEWHWLKSTPSWWTHMNMIKPKRREGRLWEAEIVKEPLDKLEDSVAPDVSKKPHQYYW